MSFSQLFTFIYLFFFFFFQGEATIHYNKLQADPKQGKSLDIGIFSMKYMLTINHQSLVSLVIYICV